MNGQEKFRGTYEVGRCGDFLTIGLTRAGKPMQSEAIRVSEIVAVRREFGGVTIGIAYDVGNQSVHSIARAEQRSTNMSFFQCDDGRLFDAIMERLGGDRSDNLHGIPIPYGE